MDDATLKQLKSVAMIIGKEGWTTEFSNIKLFRDLTESDFKSQKLIFEQYYSQTEDNIGIIHTKLIHNLNKYKRRIYEYKFKFENPNRSLKKECINKIKDYAYLHALGLFRFHPDTYGIFYERDFNIS